MLDCNHVSWLKLIHIECSLIVWQQRNRLVGKMTELTHHSKSSTAYKLLKIRNALLFFVLMPSKSIFSFADAS